MKEDTNKRVNSVLRDLASYYEELYSLPEDSPIRNSELALINTELSYMAPVDVRLITDRYYAAMAGKIQGLVDRIKEIYRREFGLKVVVFFSTAGTYALRILYAGKDGKQHDDIIAPNPDIGDRFTLITLLEMPGDIRDQLFTIALELSYLIRDVNNIAEIANKLLASGCPASGVFAVFANAVASFINDVKTKDDGTFLNGLKVKTDPSSYTVYVWPEDVELFGPGTVAVKTTYTQFLNPSDDAKGTFERLKNVKPNLYDYLHKEVVRYCSEYLSITNSVKEAGDE